MVAIPPVCDFGWKAIDATLPGVDGKEHSIFEQVGANGFVVAFICNHCPYVVSAISRIVEDAKELKDCGVGFVAINSNDAKTYPQDSFDNMKKFSQKNAFPFPYIYDENQDVARKYDAVCTPDFFGFNKDMELQYRGQFDNSRQKNGDENLHPDLFEAMKLVAETGKGPQKQIASMGCSIKWKEESL